MTIPYDNEFAKQLKISHDILSDLPSCEKFYCILLSPFQIFKYNSNGVFFIFILYNRMQQVLRKITIFIHVFVELLSLPKQGKMQEL